MYTDLSDYKYWWITRSKANFVVKINQLSPHGLELGNISGGTGFICWTCFQARVSVSALFLVLRRGEKSRGRARARISLASSLKKQQQPTGVSHAA